MQQSQGSICIDMNTEKDALSLTCTVQPTLQNGPISCTVQPTLQNGKICTDMNREKDTHSLTCTLQPTLQNGPIKIAVYISGTTAILVSMNM